MFHFNLFTSILFVVFKFYKEFQLTFKRLKILEINLRNLLSTCFSSFFFVHLISINNNNNKQIITTCKFDHLNNNIWIIICLAIFLFVCFGLNTRNHSMTVLHHVCFICYHMCYWEDQNGWDPHKCCCFFFFCFCSLAIVKYQIL